MRWDEDWRRAERPRWEDVKIFSTLWPNLRGRRVAGFFVGVTVLHYAAVWVVGYSSTLYLGLPPLYWLSIGIVVLTFGGMCALILGSDEGATVEEGRRDRTASETSDDEC